jgi:hypothetical protein
MLPGRAYGLLPVLRTPPGWRSTSEGLVCQPPERNATLTIPVEVAGSYRLNVEFTRRSGEHSVNINFPLQDPGAGAVGKRVATLYLDVGEGGESIVGSAAEHARRPDGNLETGRRYELQIEVKVDALQAAIDVDLDGQDYLQWSGSVSSFPTSHPTGPFSLGSYDGDTVFHKLRLEVLEGHAQWRR